jgi:hypothetical protein
MGTDNTDEERKINIKTRNQGKKRGNMKEKEAKKKPEDFSSCMLFLWFFFFSHPCNPS